MWENIFRFMRKYFCVDIFLIYFYRITKKFTKNKLKKGKLLIWTFGYTKVYLTLKKNTKTLIKAQVSKQLLQNQNNLGWPHLIYYNFANKSKKNQYKNVIQWIKSLNLTMGKQNIDKFHQNTISPINLSSCGFDVEQNQVRLCTAVLYGKEKFIWCFCVLLMVWCHREVFLFNLWCHILFTSYIV